jgi:hypothetical protein
LAAPNKRLYSCLRHLIHCRQVLQIPPRASRDAKNAVIVVYDDYERLVMAYLNLIEENANRIRERTTAVADLKQKLRGLQLRQVIVFDTPGVCDISCIDMCQNGYLSSTESARHARRRGREALGGQEGRSRAAARQFSGPRHVSGARERCSDACGVAGQARGVEAIWW